MRLKYLISSGAIFLALCTAASAQAEFGACESVYALATRNVSVSQRDISVQHSLFRSHCEENGASKRSTWDASANAIINAVPIGISFGSDSESTQIQSFCKNHSERLNFVENIYQKNEIIIVDALRSFNQCIHLSKQDIKIYHTDNHPVSATLTIQVNDPNSYPRVTAIGYDKDYIECKSNNLTSDELSKLPGVLDKEINRTFELFCERKKNIKEGSLEYITTPVQIQTSAGDYQFRLNGDELYTSVELASLAKNKLEVAETQIAQLTNDLEVANRRDLYPVFVVGPGLNGALTNVPTYIRTVGCLRPVTLQNTVIADQMRLACKNGYEPVLVGEISHVGGGACGQTVVQINCARN